MRSEYLKPIFEKIKSDERMESLGRFLKKYNVKY